MPSLRYLNSVLTIIAVLLTINVYTLWTVAPAHLSPASEAHAQADAPGLPNAGKQRKDMLDELKKISAEVAALKGVLTSGKVRVTVDNPPKAD